MSPAQINPAPTLIFAYGNPGRGDDALGPELIAAIDAMGLGDVECLDDMQLQIEHVTDLVGRSRIIFVDADASCVPPCRLEQITARRDDSYTSHAMSPAALLHAYRQVYGTDAPEAWLLRIRGYDFELGQPLSDAARNNLATAVTNLSSLCREPAKPMEDLRFSVDRL